MLARISFRRSSAIALTLIALGTFSACGDDDPVAPDEEPEIGSVRLTVAGTSVTVSTTQSPTLTVASGTNAVTAEWFKPDGAVETIVTDAEFELRIAQASGTGTLTWTPTGARGGTLVVTGLAAGASAAAKVSLFHKAEQHTEVDLNFTVRVP